jgi:hypothetical protein
MSEQPRIAADDRRCSFCGKGRDDVRTIITAEAAAICDECVDLCVELLVKQGITRPGGTLPEHWRRCEGHSDRVWVVGCR